MAGDLAQPRDEVVGEPPWIGGQRLGWDDAHQLPVAGGRVLARPDRVQAAVECLGTIGRRNPRDRAQVAQAQALEHRQVQAADHLGEVHECVRAGIAVVSGVRQGTRADSVHHHHDGPPHFAIRTERSSGRKTCSSTRLKSLAGANASITISALGM